MVRDQFPHPFPGRFVQADLLLKGGIDLQETVIFSVAFSVEQHFDHAVPFIHRVEEGQVALLARRLFRLPALGDVVDGQQNPIGSDGGVAQAAGVEQHRALAQLRELMVHLEIIESVILREDFLEQRPQPGNVPLAIAQVVNEPADGFFGRHPKVFIEGAARAAHAQGTVQHQQRLAHRVHGGLSEVKSRLDALVSLDLIDVHQHRTAPSTLLSSVR